MSRRSTSGEPKTVNPPGIPHLTSLERESIFLRSSKKLPATVKDFTGPAFLPGLVNHFNVLSYEMSETSKRVTRYQNESEELENSKYEAEQHGEIFEHYEELLKYEQLLQQELQKGDDIANNLNATLRLIDKCQKISKSGNDNDSSSTQLVPVGTVQDVGFLLESEADEMYQLQAICNGAELFPETEKAAA